MNTEKNAPDKPQVYVGDSRADEMMLLGNREGLYLLHEAIETALANGEASISSGGMEFNGVRCVDESRNEESSSLKDGIPLAGCLILAGVCLAIFLFGLWSLIDLLSKN